MDFTFCKKSQPVSAKLNSFWDLLSLKWNLEWHKFWHKHWLALKACQIAMLVRGIKTNMPVCRMCLLKPTTLAQNYKNIIKKKNYIYIYRHIIGTLLDSYWQSVSGGVRTQGTTPCSLNSNVHPHGAGSHRGRANKPWAATVRLSVLHWKDRKATLTVNRSTLWPFERVYVWVPVL